MEISRVLFSVAMLSAIVLPGPVSADMDAGYAALESENYELARQEFEPLAEGGNRIAQYNLAALYRQGQGGPADLELAAHWFRKSAEQGNSNAAFALGVLLMRGEGVETDLVEAYMWYRIASEKGHQQARKNLLRIARAMTGEQVKQARQMAAEWEPQP